MAAMKEPTKRVIKYLQKHNGEDLTAGDVAEALGFEERENTEGKHDKVKYLRLTEKGMNLDVDNPTAE